MKNLFKALFLLCGLTLMSVNAFCNPIVVARGTISEIYLYEDGSWFVEVYITHSGNGMYINIESSTGYSTYNYGYEEMFEGFYVFRSQDFEDFEFDPNGDYLVFDGGDGIETEKVIFGDYPGSEIPSIPPGCALVNRAYDVYGGNDWTFDGKPTKYYYSDDFMPGNIRLTVCDYDQEPIGNMAICSPTIDPEYFAFGDDDGLYYPLIRCDLEPVSFSVSDLINTYYEDELFVYPGDTVEHTISLDINNYSSLQGIITMEDGTSAVGAKILLTPINPQNESFTGIVERENGFYNMSAKTGIYQICVYNEGFAPQFLLDGVSVVGAVSEDFVLSPDNNCIYHETENEMLSGVLDEGIHYLLTDVTVPENQTLYVNENTEIHIAFGKKIVVQGEVNAMGVDENTVLFSAHCASQVSNDFFIFENDYHTTEFVHCTFENIPKLFTLIADSIHMEHCKFLENKCIGDLSTDSYLNIQHSFIQSSEMARPVISLFDNSTLCLSESVFDQSGEIYLSDSTIANIDHSIFMNMIHSISVADSGTLNLNNNLFSNNDIGLYVISTIDYSSLLHVLFSDLKVFNNLFINNDIAVSADVEGIFNYYGLQEIKYNDFWNNTTDFRHKFIYQIGSINTYNGNDDPSDRYFNIFLDPQLDDHLHLTWDSPCINAGNPDSPQNPDGTIADIGPFFFDLSTSIKERSNDIIHVNSYPNPTTDILNFDISANQDISGTVVLTIYNMNGVPVTKVFEPVSASNTTSISLSLKNRGINAGLYVYTLIIPGQDATSGKITVIN